MPIDASTAVLVPPQSRRPPAKHQVHFYESRDALGVPAEYIAAGLAAGCAVFALTKDSHSAELRRRLQENFVDVDEAVRTGRLTFLSAEEACESICVDGEPVPERFDALIGRRIREVAARQIGRRIRVWGEMVDVFRSTGRTSAALRIEEMWNDLLQTENFATLCSYDVQHLAIASGDIALVESLHGRTHDSEAFVDADPSRAARAKELEAAVQQSFAIEEELREQSRVNANLVRIATVLTSELDLNKLVQKVTDEATALCRAQFGAFFHHVENEGESYMLYTLSGAPREAFSKFPMVRSTELFRPTFEGTAVVRSDDVTKDPRYAKNPPYHGVPKGHLPVRSYLAVPVKSRHGRILGALLFGHTKPGVFTSADEQLAVSVAGQAAVAMDNASLFRAVRRAESIAQMERETFHQLFKQSPAIISILRGPELVCDFLNDAALAVVHHKDVIGRSIRDVSTEVVLERLHQIEEVYRTGQRWSGDAVPMIRTWDESQQPTERFFNIVFEPFRGHDGSVDGVMTFGFDVTEQVLTARKLEALAQELELANRMKDEFLATVSHELRTPLNAILGWVRMLRAGNLPMAKWERALETIERNANAQTQLIEDLLDVSRIISGKLRLEVDTVDLAAVIENAIEAVRPAAEAKCITIRQTLDGAARNILGDKDRLQQVVWNLLTNAVKFTPKGGTVTATLRRVDGTVEICVADTGQGIEADFVQKVFERFRQIDATPARKQGGLGLGLAIVRHLVELHGGAVRADSAGLGKGAAFTVILPIALLRSPTTERPPVLRARPTGAFECPPELAGVRVLVVDDEADARDLLSEILTRCHADVLSAATCAEALRMVRDLHPDIVVSDIGMPEEDGYVFIKRLRALSRDDGGKTPAIALTAYARVEDRTKALVAGFNMHVPKPVEPSELLAVLRGLVSMFAGE